MVGGCIAHDGIANIKFLRRVIRRDSDGFENLLACDYGMGALRGDIEGRNRQARSMSDGLRFTWTRIA